MGVWLMPEPECYLPGWVMVPRDDDLGPMVDTLRELMLGGSITGYPMILSPVAAASVFTDRAHWHQGEGVLPEEAIERICSELGFGRWTMRFAIHGDEAIVDHRFAKVQEAFGRIEGATVIGTKVAGQPRCTRSRTRPSGCRRACRTSSSCRWGSGTAARRAATSASRRRRR